MPNTAPIFGVSVQDATPLPYAGSDFLTDLAVQADGKLLLAGGANGMSTFRVARLNVDGSLDPGFGVGGTVLLEQGWARHVEPLADGRILVAGTSNDAGQARAVVARLTSTGQLDTSFASGGDFEYDGFFLTSMVRLADGSVILAGGFDLADWRSNVGAIKLTPSGSLDTSFGNGGRLQLPEGPHSLYTSVQVDGTGRLLFGGFENSDANGHGVPKVWRFNADGTPDTAFGTAGVTDLPVVGDTVDTLLVQADGRVLVGAGAALYRLTAGGSLDGSFGNGGVVSLGTDDVLLQPDGKIVLANGNYSGSSVYRLNPDGTLDSSFGDQGEYRSEYATAAVVATDGAGNLLIGAGVGSGTGEDWAILKLDANGGLVPGFGQQGSVRWSGSAAFIEDAAPVVLEPAAGIHDAEMYAAGSYAGASLTLARHEGASEQDVFSATGPLTIGVDGALALNGVPIGTATQSVGVLTLTFNGNATPDRVNAAMAHIAYANASDAPPASVRIDWTFAEGDAPGSLSTTASTTVSITPVNDPPVGSVTVAADETGTLTADVSLTDADGIVGPYAHVWLRDGAPLGASGPTYATTAADGGHLLSVRVEYTDGAGTVELVASAPVYLPLPTGPVVISGTVAAGRILTADTSAVAGIEGSYGYTWLRDGQPITEAMGKTLVLGEDDVGKAIAVQISYTDTAGHAATQLSAPTPAVGAPQPLVQGWLLANADDVHGMELWATDGTPEGTILVKDIAPGAGSSAPSGFTPLGDGHYLFTAFDKTNGQELWITDGTSDGTQLLKDINPGSASSSVQTMHAVGGGKFLFQATTAASGREWWMTDGTAAGTRLLKDVNPGTGDGGDALLEDPVTGWADGKLFFRGYNASTGSELWATDGTPEGTALFKDLAPGAGDSAPGEMIALGGRSIFLAKSTPSGGEWWVTDGTAGGTTLLKDIYPSGQDYIHYRWLLGDKVVFSAYSTTYGQEMWVTDGTTAGTVLLKDINTGSVNSDPKPFWSPSGGSTLFTATTAANGVELWKTDGTTAGTVLVKDIRAGTASSSPAARAALDDGRILFTATSGSGTELWITDTTSAGTVLLKDITTGSGSTTFGRFLKMGDGRVLFTASSTEAGSELWITDGTAVGTVMLKDIHEGTTGSSIDNLSLLAGNRAIFSANDGTHGREYWVTDGTAAGTSLLKDLWGGGSGSPVALNVSAKAAPGDGLALIYAWDEVRGHTLWSTDGTPEGTVFLHDMQNVVGASSPASFTTLSPGHTVFSAKTPENGIELWVTDGSTAGTRLLRDINPGTGDASVGAMTVLGNGRALFTATDGATGTEPWVTDGTAAGTLRLHDINPGTGSSSISSFVLAPDGRAVFVATNATHGAEVWVTDGTVGGTQLLQDINAGSAGSSPAYFVRLADDRLLFNATDATHGSETWITDGTPAGTRLVEDLNPGTGSSGATLYTELGNGTILFSATNGTSGTELWATGSDFAGGRLVKDINAGTAGSSPNGFTSLGGHRVVFAATDANGSELWVTDGSTAGTHMVVDIHPVTSMSSSPSGFVALGGGKVLFQAANATAGRELWVTDGSAAGTVLLQDINAGTATSSPASLTPLGNGKAVFVATDATHGQEPWVTDGTATGTLLLQDIAAGSTGSGASRLTALGDGHLVFSAKDAAGQYALWCTDGTSAGTAAIAAITLTSNLYPLGDGRFVFTASDAEHLSEPWVTDGTAAGTRLLRDINPGAVGSAAGNFTPTGDGRIVFQATDYLHGYEPWITDGTPEGTRLVRDIAEASLTNNFVQSAVPFAAQVAPTSGHQVITMAEDAVHAFSAADFPFADANAGDAMVAVVIARLPASGTLTLADSPVTTGQRIPATDIAAGKLKYTPAANATGALGDFGFQVEDGSGLRSAVATFSFDATPVNDAPAGEVKITGIAAQGLTVAADPTALADPDGLGAFSYQWLRNGATIPDATASTYQVTAVDVGSAISVRVAYHDAGGTGESVTSAALTGFISTVPTAGDDRLTGTSGADALDGGAGNDTMLGGGGNDTYYVDSLGDVVTETSGQGIDTVHSSVNYTLGTHAEHLVLTATHLTGSGNASNNLLVGSEGDDALLGQGGDDTLQGGAGNDVLTGGAGSDTLDGGAGDDTAVYAGNRSTFTITAVAATPDARGYLQVGTTQGVDTLYGIRWLRFTDGTVEIAIPGIFTQGTAMGDNLSGTEDADSLSGMAGSDTLSGAEGNDTLDGGADADRLVGGAGDDTYGVDAAGDIIVEAAGEGLDVVLAAITFTLPGEVENLVLTGTAANSGTGNAAANALTGNAAANRLTGLDGNDSLYGGDGSDTLGGGAGDDLVDGGSGADLLYGGDGNDVLVVDDTGDLPSESAGAGNDTVRALLDWTLGTNLENLVLEGDALTGWGNSLANLIVGNGGANRLMGLGGADTLQGGTGDDTLDGGGQVDRMEGGAGDDTYVVDTATDSIIELAGEGVDTVQSPLTFTLPANVEQLTLTGVAHAYGTGNAGANRIQGNDGNNKLAGDDGNDTLLGGAGADTLEGGLGNDSLDGGTGTDRLVGGKGNDTYVVEAGDVVVEASGAGTDTVQAWADFTLPNYVEKIVLLGSATRATGNGQGNTLLGNALANVLRGGGGSDTLEGDAGSDLLDGGTGNDQLRGGLDDDTLEGGSGNDTLDGGEGADRFVFAAASGSDVIHGFAPAEGDRIALPAGLNGSAITTAAAALAAAVAQGADTVIPLGGGHTVTLVGIAPAALTADQFDVA